MTDAQPINISILDKDYKVACQPGEQSALLESARFLDHKMREVRDSGTILGSERIANPSRRRIRYKTVSSNCPQLARNKIANRMPATTQTVICHAFRSQGMITTPATQANVTSSFVFTFAAPTLGRKTDDGGVFGSCNK